MNQVVEYKIVPENGVQTLIEHGWQPLGGVCCLSTGGFVQAMVKYKQPSKLTQEELEYYNSPDRTVPMPASLQKKAKK